MLIWVCALHCEAKPIIDRYRLKKLHDDCAFDLYLGEKMACIISGTGKIASAAATAWVASRFNQQPSIAWINLGIAGAAQQTIGSLFLITQIKDADSNRRYYPTVISNSVLATAACVSLNRASDNYHAEHLYDMEASGFIDSALRFSSSELTQCIKIISDNEHEKVGRNRQRVSDLIHQHINSIDQQAKLLVQLNDEISERELPVESWRRIVVLARFSQTQQNRLRVLLRYLLNRNYSVESLLAKIDSQSSSKSIIEILEQLSYQDSARL